MHESILGIFEMRFFFNKNIMKAVYSVCPDPEIFLDASIKVKTFDHNL